MSSLAERLLSLVLGPPVGLVGEGHLSLAMTMNYRVMDRRGLGERDGHASTTGRVSQ